MFSYANDQVHWEYQSLTLLQVEPATQQVAPDQPVPPHCPHLAAQFPDTVVVVGMGENTDVDDTGGVEMVVNVGVVGSGVDGAVFEGNAVAQG